MGINDIVVTINRDLVGHILLQIMLTNTDSPHDGMQKRRWSKASNCALLNSLHNHTYTLELVALSTYSSL